MTFAPSCAWDQQAQFGQHLVSASARYLGFSAARLALCRRPGVVRSHSQVQRVLVKKRGQRTSKGHVHGVEKRKARGSSIAAEKKMISALPIRFSSGTKPTPCCHAGTRLSMESSRLSPIMKYA